MTLPEQPDQVHEMCVASALDARQVQGIDHPYVLHLAGADSILTVIFAAPGPAWPLAMAGNLGPLLHVATVTLVAEAYTTEGDPGDLPEVGQVQHQFNQGSPDVTECVQVVTVWRQGAAIGTTLPYRRLTPSRHRGHPTPHYVQWGARFDGALDPDGAVSAALTEAARTTTGRTLPGTEREQYEACGQWATDAGGCIAAVAPLTDLLEAWGKTTAPPGGPPQ